MYSHLEDEFGDIIGKARRGQELSSGHLAAQVGLSANELQRIENYELVPPQDQIQALAAVLGLAPDKLKASAAGDYFPANPSGTIAEELSVDMLVLGTDFLMNGYLVGCPATNKGVVVDPGFDNEKIFKAIENAALEIELVLLTHGHHDHIGALEEVCRGTEAPALIHRLDEPMLGPQKGYIESFVEEGDKIGVGNLEFAVYKTPGHTPGSVSFVHKRAAFVGDAIFAGSLGGTRAKGAYEQQRQAIAQHILGLEDPVVLYPGHGPATTVGEEKTHNPFFL